MTSQSCSEKNSRTDSPWCRNPHGSHVYSCAACGESSGLNVGVSGGSWMCFVSRWCVHQSPAVFIRPWLYSSVRGIRQSLAVFFNPWLYSSVLAVFVSPWLCSSVSGCVRHSVTVLVDSSVPWLYLSVLCCVAVCVSP